ncbi:MAG: hypothetical protein ISF22_10050 [Methanomassiliicoccus sp.]|nr:hypothetical protein [Methanomassiliicoccus sp.]
MKQEVKAFLDMVGGRRVAIVQKQDPEVKANHVVDDQSPRAVVKVEKNGKVVAFEFVETVQTAAVHANLEDYVFAANEFGTVSVALPASDYAPGIAVNILTDLKGRIRKSGATGEFLFTGYLYDDMGGFRKLL